MRKWKRNKNIASANQGFSLLELMAAMAILAVIATWAVPQYYKQVRKAKQQTAKTQIEMLMTGMQAYRMDIGDFPSQNEGIEALMTDPGIEEWDGPYLSKAIPKDPWKNDYHYQNPGQHGEIDIFSLGKDNQEGGDKENKDIGSW